MPEHRLLQFSTVGLGNSLVGLLVIFACKELFNFSDVAANVSGYSIGILLGFLMNKRWTFRYAGDAGAAFARYLLVLFVAYAVNLAIVIYVIDVLTLNSYLAQATGIAPYAATGYLGSRYFAFASTKVQR